MANANWILCAMAHRAKFASPVASPERKKHPFGCGGADSWSSSAFAAPITDRLEKAVTLHVSLRENLPQAAFRSLAHNRTPLAHQRVAPRKRKKHCICSAFHFLEAPPRIELGVKVLQTSALPLGYGAE